MGTKAEPIWKPDSSGLIKESKVSQELSADTSADLLLRNALQCRSLAFDYWRLVAHNVLERWTDLLLDAYLTPAMSGRQRVSIEQRFTVPTSCSSSSSFAKPRMASE